MANDSLKASIAELLGKKGSELRPPEGPNVVRNWQSYLADQGYVVTRYYSDQKVSDRHIVLYGAADGSIQAALSDSPEAAAVRPLGRLMVTKAPKTGSSKEA